MVASSCYASPLCTWFVAACMFVAHGGGGESRQVVTLQSGGRSRRRRLLNKTSAVLSNHGSSSIQALVTSCFDFGPCSHYNSNSNALSSLFGTNSVSLYRNQRRLNRAASFCIAFVTFITVLLPIWGFVANFSFSLNFSLYVPYTILVQCCCGFILLGQL